MKISLMAYFLSIGKRSLKGYFPREFRAREISVRLRVVMNETVESHIQPRKLHKKTSAEGLKLRGEKLVS